MRNVVVAGKGSLAIAATKAFITDRERYAIQGVVPVDPEPDWINASFAEWARNLGIRVLSYDDLLDFASGKSWLLFSVFYDRVFDSHTLDGFETALNVHPSPLPRYRGVRPINWALKNGERMHGVTVHEMTERVDAGPIYAQALFPLFASDSLRDAYDRMIRYAKLLLPDVIAHIDDVVPREQDESQSSVHYSSQNDQLGEWASW